MWHLPPTNLILSSNDVHVWRATLDCSVECMQNLAQTLSADERTRAERFYFERDRKRFIVGRGVLRTILSRYSGIAAKQLQFCYGPRGKPDLAETSGVSKLQFNLSHSQELVLYAVTRDRLIGIDIEYMRPMESAGQIVKSFFSVRESAVWHSLPVHQQQTAFFNCWTRKEAFVKAVGDGLALPLDRFDVSLVPGEPARLLEVQGDRYASDRWSLQELTPAPGYAAAVAVEGHNWQMTCWEWQELGVRG